MEKVKVQRLLIKEVIDSNLSAIAKGMICELLEAESGTRGKLAKDMIQEVWDDANKPVFRSVGRPRKAQPADEGKRNVYVLQTGKKVEKAKRKRTNKYSRLDWPKILDTIAEAVAKKPLNLNRLCKIVKIRKVGGSRAKLGLLLLHDKRFELSKKGGTHYFGLKSAKQPYKADYMLVKGFYHQFMSDKIKYHMKVNKLDYLAASNAAKAEYAKIRATKPKEPEFPKISGIKANNIGTFKETLRFMAINTGFALYAKDMFAIMGIDDASTVQAFMADVLRHGEALKAALGITKQGGWASDGFKLYWRD